MVFIVLLRLISWISEAPSKLDIGSILVNLLIYPVFNIRFLALPNTPRKPLSIYDGTVPAYCIYLNYKKTLHEFHSAFYLSWRLIEVLNPHEFDFKDIFESLNRIVIHFFVSEVFWLFSRQNTSYQIQFSTVCLRIEFDHLF